MRLKLVRLVVMLALALLTASRAADTQPSPTGHRLGWLSGGSPRSGPSPSDEAFLQGLRDRGYVEGRNLIIERRWAEGHVERLPDLAAELVRLHIDVIVTIGTPALRAAKQATRAIPIVMTQIGTDPVAAGHVTSLARPEGNVTGVVALGTDLWEKRLALLKEVVPRLTRLALLWKPAQPINALCFSEVKAVALAMGVQLHALEVRDAQAFEPAFAALAQEPPDALVTCWEAVTLAHARPIADFAVRHRLPTLTAVKAYVEAGHLLSYGTSVPGHMRRAADYVDKLLKGTKPADLPVERPMQFELVMNLQTAQALGVTLPPMLLFQATEVIR